MNGVEFSFNWFYADDKRHRIYSSGRLPIRASGHRPRAADGRHRGLRLARLPPVRRAPAGDRPASRGDPQLEQQACRERRHRRLELLVRAGPARRSPAAAARDGKKQTLASVTSRDEQGGDAGSPGRARVAGRSGRCSPQARRRVRAPRRRPVCSTSWRTTGSSRIDSELDGKVDDPGAAVMDAAWPRLADAVMTPVLGPLAGRLAALNGRSDDPDAGGSAYISGWYGYVDKDLRTLLGREVRGAVLASLLRSGRSRDLPGSALGRARRGRPPSSRRRRGLRRQRGGLMRSGERIRFTSGVLPTPCAGRIGRPSSSSCRSPRTGPAPRYPRTMRKRYLMAPGPTPVPPEVLAAGAAPDHSSPRA